MAETEKDRDILASTLLGKARGESLAGQIAVARTNRNRVNDGKTKSWWGEGYASVRRVVVLKNNMQRFSVREVEVTGHNEASAASLSLCIDRRVTERSG
ncbi:hypothetical protein PMI26_03663 [Pseudomonas sp. GM33]|nr:hypothetical protein PMI26_03663 [Pseudomonas sp. GM33]